MNYREPMPENCPPAGAQEIAADVVVFRLAQTSPATLGDFRSLLAMNPNGNFSVTECLARGLSVHADLRDSEQARKLPKFRNWFICSVRLEAGAGRIQQTFKPLASHVVGIRRLRYSGTLRIGGSVKTIRYSATLFYYDGPQVFEARDAIGGHYVAVMVEPEAGRDRYLVAGVSPERLRQFRVGLLDMRSLLMDEREDVWYLSTIEHGFDRPLVMIEQTTPITESDMLPEPGFVLHDRPADLKGMLDKADLGAGTWSILTENGPYSGKIKQGGPSLAGLKLGGVYHFSCMEEIENTDATGTEKRTLYLLEHEPV